MSDLQSQLELLKNDVEIKNYFADKNILHFVKKYIKIEKETIAWSKELVDIEMERLGKGQTDITALYQIQTDYENAAILLSDAIYQRTITYNKIKFILGNVQ